MCRSFSCVHRNGHFERTWIVVDINDNDNSNDFEDRSVVLLEVLVLSCQVDVGDQRYCLEMIDTELLLEENITRVLDDFEQVVKGL